MSDASGGTGWWQASDGKWYPPNPGGSTPLAPGPRKGSVSDYGRRGWNKYRSLPLPVQVFLAVSTVVLVVGVAASASTEGEPERSKAAPVAVSSTTRPNPAATSSPATSPAVTTPPPTSPSVTTVSGDDDMETDDQLANLGAFDVCKQFVEPQLKAPDGATWRNPLGNQVTYTGASGGPVTVAASVDSENSFGAKLRSTYECTVTPTGADNWRLTDLQFNDGGDVGD